MISFFKKTSLIILGTFFPLISFAQEARGKTASQILEEVANIIDLIIPILIGAALLVFLWGVLKYFYSQDAKNRQESINYILWGIISLFVMVAIWGLVNVLQSSFLGETDPSEPPREEIQSLQDKPKTEASRSVVGEGPIFDVLRRIVEIIEAALPFLILVGVLLVIWGIFKYAFSPESSKKQEAVRFITWAIIGLTVMVAIWSLVVYLQRTVFEGRDPGAIGESGAAVKELQKDPIQEGQFSAAPPDGGINIVISKVADIVNTAIPLLISLGILIFLWGVFKYVSSDSSKIKSEGVALMSWGVIMLLVMGSVWYFVNLIAESTDISLEQQPNIGKQGVSPSELIIK